MTTLYNDTEKYGVRQHEGSTSHTATPAAPPIAILLKRCCS